MPASPPGTQPADQVRPAGPPTRPRRQRGRGRGRRRLHVVDVLVGAVVVALVGGIVGAHRLGLAPRQPVPAARQTTGTPTTIGPPPPPVLAAPVPAAPPPTTPAPTTTTTTTTTVFASPFDLARPFPYLEAGPAPEPTPFALRRPSTGQPVHVLVVGDSLAGGLAAAVGRAGAVDGSLTARSRAVAPSGLARPDVFDWPEQIASVVTPEDELVVIFIGLNDAQALARTTARTAGPGTSSWAAAYAARVARLIEGTGPRPVVLVGLPAVESPGRDRELEPVRAALAAEAARHTNVRYLDLNRTVSDGGRFLRWLDGGDGQQVAARSNDGEQFTDDGNDLVARLLVDAVWPPPGS